MKHIITKYPEDTPYHDDMHDETVFIIGLPFWDVFGDNSRSHHFFGDFRAFNGVPLGKMDEVLSMLAPALLQLQRVMIEARLDRDGFADMAWTDASLRKITKEPVAQQDNLKGFCEVCGKVTEWEFYCHQRDKHGAILFTLHNCVKCNASKDLGRIGMGIGRHRFRGMRFEEREEPDEEKS